MPLTEFYKKYPDCKLYNFINQIIDLLQEIKDHNKPEIYKKLKDLLNAPESDQILEFICSKTNNKQNIPKPRLLLHLILLVKCHESVPLVANKLGVDSGEATELLDKFHHTFTVDDPLIWLQNFQKYTHKEQQQCEIDYDSLMHGREVINQPKDTAERRRVKLRNKIFGFFSKFNK